MNKFGRVSAISGDSADGLYGFVFIEGVIKDMNSANIGK
jgi:hypothetical protein